MIPKEEQVKGAQELANKPGRPRKVIEESPSDADVISVALTEDEIRAALDDYIVSGVKFSTDGNAWNLSKGKLAVSGNLRVPLKAVVHGAEHLVAQEYYVRMANRKDSKGRRAIGDIYDKSGDDITNQR